MSQYVNWRNMVGVGEFIVIFDEYQTPVVAVVLYISPQCIWVVPLERIIIVTADDNEAFVRYLRRKGLPFMRLRPRVQDWIRWNIIKYILAKAMAEGLGEDTE